MLDRSLNPCFAGLASPVLNDDLFGWHASRTLPHEEGLAIIEGMVIVASVALPRGMLRRLVARGCRQEAGREVGPLLLSRPAAPALVVPQYY